MPTPHLEELALRLSANRKAGRVSDLPLHDIQSEAEAEAIQAAALDDYDEDFVGYTLVGTSLVCQRMLGVRRPFYAPLPNRAFHSDGNRIVLPQGMIGAQCELAFTIGAALQGEGSAINRDTMAAAVVTCWPTIGLLGRRTPPASNPELGAIADFGLHVATICGPMSMDFDRDALDQVQMTARIDGKPMISARGDAVLGHPLEAVAWLVRELARQDRRISAGDIGATGSFGPILQVLPGQQLTVAFERIGEVSCRFD